jgi:hypothetical protein
MQPILFLLFKHDHAAATLLRKINVAGKVSVEFQRRVGVAANTEMSANRPALLLHEVDAKRDASLTSVQTLHPRTCQVAVSQQTLIRPPFQLSGRSSLGPAFPGLKPAEAVGYFVFALRAMQLCSGFGRCKMHELHQSQAVSATANPQSR